MPFVIGFDFMFTAVFVPVVVCIIVVIGKVVSTWNKNNHSPRLVVEATVISKRKDFSVHGDGDYTTSDTRYYVTFQVESGDRIEFHVRGTEYGMLVEGDVGRLWLQGTRYLGFDRR